MSSKWKKITTRNYSDEPPLPSDALNSRKRRGSPESRKDGPLQERIWSWLQLAFGDAGSLDSYEQIGGRISPRYDANGIGFRASCSWANVSCWCAIQVSPLRSLIDLDQPANLANEGWPPKGRPLGTWGVSKPRDHSLSGWGAPSVGWLLSSFQQNENASSQRSKLIVYYQPCLPDGTRRDLGFRSRGWFCSRSVDVSPKKCGSS